jgi:hypothetical protein
MRPKDNVWADFDIETEDGKLVRAVCRHCREPVSAKVLRLKTHLSKCRKMNAIEVDEQSHRLAPATTSSTVVSVPVQEAQVDDPEATSGSTSEAPKRKLQQPKIHQYGVAVSRSFKQKVDEQLARRALVACNLPFCTVEEPEFQKVFSLLNPAYKLPSRKRVADELLDTIYDQEQAEVKKELDGKKVTLLQDGWSDIHNKPVLASGVHTGTKAFLLSATETGAQKKTAAYCAEAAETAMLEVKDRYNCEVDSIVTDNENKMVAMKRIMKERHPELAAYGCSAHWANLLGQDLTPSAVLSQVLEINKFFRNHHTPESLLGAVEGSVKPQLTCATRWNSQFECLDSYLRNRPCMLAVCAQHEEEVEKRIRGLIQSADLFNQVKTLHEQLDPVAKALDRMQADSASIADACEEWLKLLQAEVLAPHLCKVQKRLDKALSPLHYFANKVHPVYQGKRLSQEQIEAIENWLLDEHSELVSEFIKWDTGDFDLSAAVASSEARANTPPTTWWKSVSRNGEGIAGAPARKKFCDLAMKCLRLPASSASIERVFSRFGLVQTQLRNRLNTQKIAKLAFCHHSLKSRQARAAT